MAKDIENVKKRINRVIEIINAIANDESVLMAVRNRLSDIQFYSEYAEPGYSDPECGVIATGNWNAIDEYNPKLKIREHVSNLPERISAILERLGVECEWQDEWCSCSNCGKLVRTSADSYSWTPSYTLGDGELNCAECVEEDPESHFKSLEGDSNNANCLDINPADHGYVRLDKSYESGYHKGQTDDPKQVAKELTDKGVERFLFNIDEVGQFDQKWSVYVHKDERGKLEPSKVTLNTYEFTEEEFREASAENQGLCLACGEVRENVEPDAENYSCECCEQNTVFGMEQALVIGKIEIKE